MTPLTQLWSKPNCIQCDATKMALDLKGEQYEEFSLLEDREALDRFKAAGYLSAPIVVTDNLTWAGFRPDLIEKL